MARALQVEMVNEPAYTVGSADNSRHYAIEVDLTEGYSATSVHGLIIDGSPALVVATSAGASRIHEHSFLVLDSAVYFAVGMHVVRFTPGRERADWILQTDEATCFGVHYSRQHDALISHGEIAISRFTREGKILWTAGGADIFSEGFEILEDCLETKDFGHRVYRFDYDGQLM